VVIMSAETLTYDQIAQRMNLMAAREVTSRLEGEIAGLRTPRQTVVPTVVVQRRSGWPWRRAG
jgi:hypothetical protein